MRHKIRLSGHWDQHQSSAWVCLLCGQRWKDLPDYADPQLNACPGVRADIPEVPHDA